jgi:hypothetical protein
VAGLVGMLIGVPQLVLAQRSSDSLLAPRSPVAPADCGACLAGPSVGLRDAATRQQPRPRAIEYSDAYGTRLTIHRIGSYVALPLFATEYIIGEKLISEERADPYARLSLRGPHSAVAAALGGVFAVNAVTGVWNLVDSRHDPSGRARRWVHSIAMLVADGGMVATAISAGSARRDLNAADHHRALAIGTMSLTTVASLMMWVWKN